MLYIWIMFAWFFLAKDFNSKFREIGPFGSVTQCEQIKKFVEKQRFAAASDCWKAKNRS